jgi:hypothetical protein
LANVLKGAPLSIPNKAKGQPLLQWCKQVSTVSPSAGVCVHWSAKFNQAKDVASTVAAFEKFYSALASERTAG